MPEQKPTIGCVIMASGMGNRFQKNGFPPETSRPGQPRENPSWENKLMVPFLGKPLICHILGITGGHLFSKRIVVTRHPEINALCRRMGIDTILHDLPGRNDTVRLGLENLLSPSPGKQSSAFQMDGCLFCPADQPLLRRETLEAMINAFPLDGGQILRPAYRVKESAPLVPGSPVLFGQRFFPELLQLPEGKGGSVLVKKYPERVVYVPVRDPYELADVDTPEALRILARHLPEHFL